MDVFSLCLFKLVSYIILEFSIAENTTEIDPTFLLFLSSTESPANLNPEDLCSLQHCSSTSTSIFSCRCDDMCGYYGDCCWHIANTKTNTSHEYYPTYPPRELLQCRSLPGIPLEAGVNGHPKGYYMVSGCPDKTEEILSNKCTSEPDKHSFIPAASFLPVRDEDGLLYKNVYCANCNGVNETNLETWKAEHNCPECPAKIEILPENKIKLVDPICQTTANYQWPTARSCSSGFLDNCPGNFTDIDVIINCSKYLQPGLFNNKVYKNPHCAVCNGLFNYHNYECSIWRTLDFFNAPLQDDLFNFWFLDVEEETLISTVRSTPEENEGEIKRLRECTDIYPQHLLLAVTIPNRQIQTDVCPYFAKRLETCILLELSDAVGQTLYLPWKQIVNFPNAEPFPTNSVLYFYIPQDISTLAYWEQVVTQVYLQLLHKKQNCGFGDLFLLRVCGNVSSIYDLSKCSNLHKFNSSEIFGMFREDGQMTLLDPSTLEPIEHVSWFGFVSSLEENGFHTNRTEICQEDVRLTTIKVTTEEDLSTIDSSISYARRLPLVEQIFSDVCISLSILGLLITFVTYCVFSSLRNIFGITLMNFVSAFGMGQILLHFVTDRLTQWKFACHAVAILTHFIWLVTFAWMTLLAWNLRSTFNSTKLRSVHYISSKLLVKYFCFGWVLPFAIVAICCVAYFFFSDTIPITYGLFRGVTCWIGNGWVVLCVVIAPLALSIFVNGIFFCQIIKGIRESKFRPEGKEDNIDDKKSKVLELLIYIKISALMGFVWTIGFLISFDESRTLWYIYYILQALQGIFIMIFFALNHRVRCMWRSKLCKVQQKSMSFSQTRNSSV